MRKVIVLSLIISIIIGLSSCGGPKNQGSLKIKFNPMFGANNIVLNSTYQAPDGKYYNFSTFKFYLSHVKLVHSDGSTTEVKSLSYFSLDDGADMGFSVPDIQGSFTGIQFNIGVDSVQDNVDPLTIAIGDTSNPQASSNNMFWDYTRKYVFVILEGHADNSTNPQNPILYHVGLSPYYINVQISKSFSVSSGGQTTLTLNSDLQKIFYGNSSSINVLTDPYTESTGSTYYTTLAHTFMTDFSQTFSLQ